MIGDTEQSYGITYKDISGLLDTYTTPQNSFDYSYDNFDRLTRKLGDRHAIQYTYVNGSQCVNTYTISQADYDETMYYKNNPTTYVLSHVEVEYFEYEWSR